MAMFNSHVSLPEGKMSQLRDEKTQFLRTKGHIKIRDGRSQKDGGSGAW